jgi:hypothetical protein
MKGQERDEIRRPKRRLIWVALAVVAVAGALTAAVSARSRGPYAFLDKFHPRHVDLDDSRVPTTMLLHGSGQRLSMLVFSPSEADAVLQSLRTELTKGYRVTNWMWLTPTRATAPVSSMQDKSWSFCATAQADEEVQFFSGSTAGWEAEGYENGMSWFVDPQPKPGCYVLITHQETWLERQWRTVKSYLNL